jgi:hypothetical protein
MKESEYTRIETYNKDAEVQDGAPKALIGAGTFILNTFVNL